jgi:hypothetical protein
MVKGILVTIMVNVRASNNLSLSMAEALQFLVDHRQISQVKLGYGVHDTAMGMCKGMDILWSMS